MTNTDIDTNYKRMYWAQVQKNKELENRLKLSLDNPNIGRIVEGNITKLLKNRNKKDFGFIKFENAEYYFDASDIQNPLIFTDLIFGNKYRFKLKESRDKRLGINKLQAHILQPIQEIDFTYDFMKTSLDINIAKTEQKDVSEGDLVSFNYKGDFQFGLVKRITPKTKRVVFLDSRLCYGRHYFKKTHEQSLVSRKFTIYYN